MSLLLPDRLAHRGQPRTDGAPSTASARTDQPGPRVDAAVPAHDGRRAAPMLSIDLDAVTANVRTIRARTRAEVMAVVKADGFGHGMTAVAVAAIAGGATRFGVTSIAEALELRRAGFTQRVLSWLNPVDADMTQAMAAQIGLAVLRRGPSSRWGKPHRKPGWQSRNIRELAGWFGSPGADSVEAWRSAHSGRPSPPPRRSRCCS